MQRRNCSVRCPDKPSRYCDPARTDVTVKKYSGMKDEVFKSLNEIVRRSGARIRQKRLVCSVSIRSTAVGDWIV